MSGNPSSSSGRGGGGGGGSSSGSGGPCGACKFLRRKCVAGCIFAPYFDSEQGAVHFAAVHKVFGASNVSKLLLHIPVHKRMDAVVSICYEALARLRDPVNGCVAHIFALQQQVVSLQAEISYLQAHLSTLDPPPPLLSITDHLPSASAMPATYVDLSSIFDPLLLHASPNWQQPIIMQAPQQQQQLQLQRQILDPRRHFGIDRGQVHGVSSAARSSSAGGWDLQPLAHELLHRHGSSPHMMPCNELPSSSSSMSK